MLLPLGTPSVGVELNKSISSIVPFTENGVYGSKIRFIDGTGIFVPGMSSAEVTIKLAAAKHKLWKDEADSDESDGPAADTQS